MTKLMWGVNAVLLAAVAFLLFTNFNQQERIAYIDTAKLLNEYEGMKLAKAAYRKKADVWQTNIDTLVNEVKGQIKAFEKDGRSMTEKEKELSQQLIRTKQQQLGEYQKAIQAKAREADVEMTQKVLTVVNGYLQEYGKSHNYKIILATTDAGNIVYGEEGMDITEDVLKGLNHENAKE